MKVELAVTVHMTLIASGLAMTMTLLASDGITSFVESSFFYFDFKLCLLSLKSLPIKVEFSRETRRNYRFKREG